MKIFVYRNLNRKGVVYSLKATEGEYKGKVLGYAPYILMENVSFVVSEKGRQRVLKERRKNVHAGVVGNIIAVSQYTPRHFELPEQYYIHPTNWQDIHKTATPITYNPYKRSTFFMTEIGYSVLAADFVSFVLNDVRAGWLSHETNACEPLSVASI